MTRPFWETKKLEEMTDEEWESVCDGCGRCCLIKLEDEDNGDVFFTNVACQLLDGDSCRCKHYPERLTYVPDCVVLDRGKLETISWLPDTCAYRLLHEGSTLFPWHPLISGDANSVHRAGISVRGVTVSETEVAEEDLEDHVIHWVS